MEAPEVPVQTLLEHIGVANVAVDVLPRLRLLGNHKGPFKFLWHQLLAAL